MKVGELYRTTKLDINCHCTITSIDRSTCPFVHYTFFDKRDNRSHNFSCPVSEFSRYYELVSQWKLERFTNIDSIHQMKMCWFWFPLLVKIISILSISMVHTKVSKLSMISDGPNITRFCDDCSRHEVRRHVQKFKRFHPVDNRYGFAIFRLHLDRFENWQDFERMQWFDREHWKMVSKSMIIPIGSIWKRKSGDELIIITATVEDTTEYFKFRMNRKDWLPTYNIPDFYKRLQWLLAIFTKIRTIAKYSCFLQ